MSKNYLMNTNFRLRSFVGITFLLTAAACGACKNDDKNKKDEKTPLKFTLTPPPEEKGAGLFGKNLGDVLIITPALKIKVTDGKDNATNYKIKVEENEASTEEKYNYSTKSDTGTSRAVLISPLDGVDLKTIFASEELKKDDDKDINVMFTPAGNNCTSQSGSAKISIIDKDGKVVGGPVEVKWTDEFVF